MPDSSPQTSLDATITDLGLGRHLEKVSLWYRFWRSASSSSDGKAPSPAGLFPLIFPMGKNPEVSEGMGKRPLHRRYTKHHNAVGRRK